MIYDAVEFALFFNTVFCFEYRVAYLFIFYFLLLASMAWSKSNGNHWPGVGKKKEITENNRKIIKSSIKL